MALECPAIGLCQFAAHVTIDQIGFGGFNRTQVVWFRKGLIFHADLFLFGQVS